MKIGIYLDSLHNSQHSFQAISSVNDLIERGSRSDFVFFYDDLALPVVRPLTATMSSNRIWGFNGVLITNTLAGAFNLTRACCSAKRIFYPTAVEWVMGASDYMTNLSIYRSPRLELVAPSEDYREAIERYSNRPINHVVEAFDVGEIVKRVLT